VSVVNYAGFKASSRPFGTTIRLTNRWNTIPGTLISRPHWGAPVSATLT
jgi:hypothetical protein